MSTWKSSFGSELNDPNQDTMFSIGTFEIPGSTSSANGVNNGSSYSTYNRENSFSSRDSNGGGLGSIGIWGNNTSSSTMVSNSGQYNGSGVGQKNSWQSSQNQSSNGGGVFGNSTYGSNTYPNNSGMRSGTNNNSSSGSSGPNGVAMRETGIIEKLLHSYGFIQCCERQARLFFHFSQFEGNIDHLKIGDPVEFEMTYDRRTGKPIAGVVQKIAPEVASFEVLSEERVTGVVTTELRTATNPSGSDQGRISFESRGECFFLPYAAEDIKGNYTLCCGDKVGFQLATDKRTGNLRSRNIQPLSQPQKFQGVVCSLKDSFGFIERADMVKEIFFHFSQVKAGRDLILGDDVEFGIETRNSKEVAVNITCLAEGSVVFEDVSTERVRGQMMKCLEKNQPKHQQSEPLPGRIRLYKDGKDIELCFGEKDMNGEHTFRAGDWVHYFIATDRRDKSQRATNIQILAEESFLVSNERREKGMVVVVKEGYGFIKCQERDTKMFFHFSELLDPNRDAKMNDEVEFTVSQDHASTGRQSATRIRLLPTGSVKFETITFRNVIGIVDKEPLSMWQRSPTIKLSASPPPPSTPLTQPTFFGDNIFSTLSSFNSGVTSSNPLVNNFTNGGSVNSFSSSSSSSSSLFSIANLNERETGMAAPVSTAEEPGSIIYVKPDTGMKEVIHFFSKDCDARNPPSVGDRVEFSICELKQTGNRTAVEVRVCSKSSITNMYTHPSTQNHHTVRPKSISPPLSHQMVNGYSNSGPETPLNGPAASLYAAFAGMTVANPAKQEPSPRISPVDLMLPCEADTKFTHKGYVAVLKDGFGFIETLQHDCELFFQFSVFDEDPSTLKVGEPVEYGLTTKSGKPYMECVRRMSRDVHLEEDELVNPEAEPLYGFVMRPLRCFNPDQEHYAGLVQAAGPNYEATFGNENCAKNGGSGDSSGQTYEFGITSLVEPQEALQKGDDVQFQLTKSAVDGKIRAVGVKAMKKRIRASVDCIKAQFGFLSYEKEEGKKLFFHMTEVKNGAANVLQPGDLVEFTLTYKNSKYSAVNVVRISGERECDTRPDRLISRLRTQSTDERATGPKVIAIRKPKGPDGTAGFNYERRLRRPGILV